MLIKYCFIVLSLFSLLTADTEKMDRMYASIFSEATAFPSYKLIRLPIHPGFSAGVYLLSQFKKRHEHALTIEGAYFYDDIAGHCLMLYPEYRFAYILWRFSLAADIGIGYKHNISSRPVYKKVDGVYKQVTDWGSPQVMLPIGLGLSFKLTNKMSIFMHYRWIAAYPFAGIPMMSHTNFHLGLSMPLPQKGGKSNAF
jgi:hypothetical protein